MFTKFILSLCFLASLQIAVAQNIFELNEKLGRGINMGNMFEAPSETAWGNPFRADYFERIADLGFNHVRIPIRWDTPSRTMQTAPYTIDANFLNRIQSVVDKAMEAGLYVIINMHHHEQLFVSPDAVKPRFLSQWQQIATYFKDYDERLLFEVLNEPNSNLTPAKWNVFFADALATIRTSNPSRAVLVGVANWGGLGSLAELVLPEDEHLILTIHYYEPFTFTHQGASWVGGNAQDWLGTTWEDTNLERQEIELQFQYLNIFASTHDIPVHIGEFGAYSRADLASRVKWTTFLARWFEEQGYSWAYWEFSAGFGIFNPSTNTYLQPLADALLSNPMPAPVQVETETIFESDFVNAGNEWFLSVQPQAGGAYNTEAGVATITVTQNSSDWWHVQLLKAGIALKQDSRYLVTFEAAADESAGFTTYVGKTFGDYSAYSSYKNFTAISDFLQYAYTFTMQSPDDPIARIVFDFASTATTFYLKNFKIQEILPETATNTEDVRPIDFSIAPNPASDYIQLTGIEHYDRIHLYNAMGVKLYTYETARASEQEIALSAWEGEVFYLVLENESRAVSQKILRF
ncbi:MAG: glycoside hydrolase family 5 protein [Bacteroidota bacterium]